MKDKITQQVKTEVGGIRLMFIELLCYSLLLILIIIVSSDCISLLIETEQLKHRLQSEDEQIKAINQNKDTKATQILNSPSIALSSRTPIFSSSSPPTSPSSPSHSRIKTQPIINTLTQSSLGKELSNPSTLSSLSVTSSVLVSVSQDDVLIGPISSTLQLADALVIPLSVLCSFLHSVSHASTTLIALDLLGSFANHLDSEIR